MSPPTYVEEIDIRIGIGFDNDTLNESCKNNKYIRSVCPNI